MHSKVSKACVTYPVIIFSPGSGSPINFYTALLEELASHGYIIVAISYPYITSSVTFPNAKIINATNFEALQQLWGLSTQDEVIKKEQELWVEDIKFVLDQLRKINHNDPHNLLTNRLNLERVGLFGHSFGGGASVSTCRALSDCKAVVNIDGRSYGLDAQKGFSTPLMFIRNPFHKKEKEGLIYELWHNMTGPSYYVVIEGMLHGSFTDLYLFSPWKADPALKLDPNRGIEITRALLVHFFDKYLRDQNGSLEHISEQFPEASLQINNAIGSLSEKIIL